MSMFNSYQAHLRKPVEIMTIKHRNQPKREDNLESDASDSSGGPTRTSYEEEKLILMMTNLLEIIVIKLLTQ